MVLWIRRQSVSTPSIRRVSVGLSYQTKLKMTDLTIIPTCLPNRVGLIFC
jgi:hypothetical protein